MKRLLWIIAALLYSIPAFAQSAQQLCFTTNGTNCVPGVQASSSSAINVAAATTTEIVAAATSKRLYVTSFNMMAAGTSNVTFKYGTGTNCGTGTVSLTGPYPLIAQAGVAAGNGTGSVLVVPASNALCVTTSGASQLSGSVSYVQF